MIEDTRVRYYSSKDYLSPRLGGTDSPNTMAQILEKCLVTGYGDRINLANVAVINGVLHADRTQSNNHNFSRCGRVVRLNGVEAPYQDLGNRPWRAREYNAYHVEIKVGTRFPDGQVPGTMWLSLAPGGFTTKPIPNWSSSRLIMGRSSQTGLRWGFYCWQDNFNSYYNMFKVHVTTMGEDEALYMMRDGAATRPWDDSFGTSSAYAAANQNYSRIQMPLTSSQTSYNASQNWFIVTDGSIVYLWVSPASYSTGDLWRYSLMIFGAPRLLVPDLTAPDADLIVAAGGRSTNSYSHTNGFTTKYGMTTSVVSAMYLSKDINGLSGTPYADLNPNGRHAAILPMTYTTGWAADKRIGYGTLNQIFKGVAPMYIGDYVNANYTSSDIKIFVPRARLPGLYEFTNSAATAANGFTIDFDGNTTPWIVMAGGEVSQDSMALCIASRQSGTTDWCITACDLTGESWN